ncbi:MAG: aminotransferase class III-fold pyridoxal phosphate-dependent enzyme [Patescibacteria group bacterium]
MSLSAGTLKRDQKTFEITDKHFTKHYSRLKGLNIISAEGNWLRDSSGKDILDMVAQYSAAGFGRGYGRPRSHKFFNEVMSAFIKEITLGCGMLPNFCYNETVANCAKSLCLFTDMDKVIFMNSGAEAFDTAVKIIRKNAYRKKLIVENNGIIFVSSSNFHGRTLGAISASNVSQYRSGFGPLLSGFGHVVFGDSNALESAFRQACLLGRVPIAFITEPIQGEGGINVPPDGYLRKAKELCRKYNVLFVLDEIQTGFGRAGYKFAWEHDGPEAKPDMMMLGKMLGGGVYPVSAVVGNKEVMDILRPGDHGSTFGGTPLACAVASKVVEIFNENPQIISKVGVLGRYFIENLLRIIGEVKNPLIKGVRGRGLLVGIEFTDKVAPLFRYNLMREGVLAGIAGHDRVLRFSPPLIIDSDEIDFAIKKIKKVFKVEA